MFSVQKTDSIQVRIEISEFKGNKFINLREWFLKDGEYLPTKKGIAITQEIVDNVIEGLQKLKSKLPTQVHQVETALDAFAIAKNSSDIVFNKKHIYAFLANAKLKSPPEGYGLYAVHIEKGVVKKHALLFRRQYNKWLEAGRKASTL